jgi:hypothetical protein
MNRSTDMNEKELRMAICAALPTPTELAQVAAALQRTEPFDARLLAENAIELWGACQQVLSACVERNVAQASGGGKTEARKAPHEFPVTFDKFLQLALPKLRTKGDRLRIFRVWAQAHIRIARAEERRLREGISDDQAFSTEREPTLEDVVKLIERLRIKGIPENKFEWFCNQMQIEEQKDLKARKSSKGKANSARRWDKSKNNKMS